MPNTKTARKRMRQNVTRKTENRARKSVIRTYTKKVLTAIEEKNLTDAEESYKVLQAKVDKASKGSTIHPNKAARRKSRMQKKLNALKAGN